MAQNQTKKALKIEGMTCVSCENKIERKLKNTPGITNVKVSYSTGKANLTYDLEVIRFNEINEIIKKLGYAVVESRDEVVKKTDLSELISGAIIIFSLYTIINHFGGFRIFNSFPIAKEGMSYGMLFVIGLLTSVHCVAMCGGINLSQCTPKINDQSDGKTNSLRLRPSILYNLGRVISYTIIGGIVGTIGSVVSFSGTAKGIVQILAGAFMVIMGLNMLNIFPWLRRFNPRMPKIFAKKINEQKGNNNSFYVGLLNGLMPCGPLQAMQLYALSTGSLIEGATSMFLFSLGTVPLMFGLGALSTILSKKFTHKMLSVSATLVVILGIFMFSSGMSLSGIAFPSSSNEQKTQSIATVSDGVQTITTNLSSNRYEAITVVKDIPVKWIIQSEDGTLNGCNRSIIVPKYNIKKDLEMGENVIEFTPNESGTFPFSCWMGMIRSQITVVDNIDNAD